MRSGVIFLTMGLLLISSVILVVGHVNGYKAGQIDALTGTVKYELVTHPDKTTTWEVKK